MVCGAPRAPGQIRSHLVSTPIPAVNVPLNKVGETRSSVREPSLCVRLSLQASSPYGVADTAVPSMPSLRMHRLGAGGKRTWKNCCYLSPLLCKAGLNTNTGVQVRSLGNRKMVKGLNVGIASKPLGTDCMISLSACHPSQGYEEVRK